MCMKCYGRRCGVKKTGYILVMLAALLVMIDGIGYIAGIELDPITKIFGDGTMWSGIVKIVIGGGGLFIMAMHCRCRACRAAMGNMEVCDECAECKDGCTMHEMDDMACDHCNKCEGGMCSMHEGEGPACDGCRMCKSGCTGHEAK